jgi:hypothetical protein
MVELVKSACPHDCPSACALEVERFSPHRIRRIRGTKDVDYTAGIVCAKVGRYAERVPRSVSRQRKAAGELGWGGSKGLIHARWRRQT